tara:strand:+ start:1041 stop:1187 length:147 start_codon:yes stop_codon:yes gene_type:complete
MWSTSSLTNKVEKILSEKEKEGWEIVSVAFGTNLWYVPTAFITIKKAE